MASTSWLSIIPGHLSVANSATSSIFCGGSYQSRARFFDGCQCLFGDPVCGVGSSHLWTFHLLVPWDLCPSIMRDGGQKSNPSELGYFSPTTESFLSILGGRHHQDLANFLKLGFFTRIWTNPLLGPDYKPSGCRSGVSWLGLLK